MHFPIYFNVIFKMYLICLYLIISEISKVNFYYLKKKPLYGNDPYPSKYVAGVNMMKNKSGCGSIIYKGSTLQKST